MTAARQHDSGSVVVCILSSPVWQTRAEYNEHQHQHVRLPAWRALPAADCGHPTLAAERPAARVHRQHIHRCCMQCAPLEYNQTHQRQRETNVFDFRVLGGGLPIGALWLIEEDRFGHYTRALHRYFLGEGAVHKHAMLVANLDEEPGEFVRMRSFHIILQHCTYVLCRPHRSLKFRSSARSSSHRPAVRHQRQLPSLVLLLVATV